MDDKVMPKPRAKCSGCAFEYQLGTARSGEFKGQMVIRKHNSRTGPGLCEGAQKPPEAVEPIPEVCQHAECGPEMCPGGTLCREDLLSKARGCVHANGYVYADDGNGHSGDFCVLCGDPAPETAEADAEEFMSPAPVAPTADITKSPLPGEAIPDAFLAPGPRSDIPEKTQTVSGQPDPDRDRWGRYLIFGTAHTRATTFAKLGANTKAIEAWNERNVIVGMTRRPDLLMLAEGKEVKRDRNDLNSIAQQAKDAAGQKVAANIGTAYHSFTERIDAGLMTLDQVPERYRPRVAQYVETVRAAGLTTRPEWMERTVAIRADQVGAPIPVAGKLDRIFQMPDGSLVIGDLKTGADLSYGEMEIEVQLALYAHGVNTHGLFDWNTRTWQDYDVRALPGITGLKVREDIAIVIHLPAEGDGCTMYVADIERGWRDAQRLGPLQASLKQKNRFRTLTRADLAPAPAPVMDPVWERAVKMFSDANSQDELAELFSYAQASGAFDQEQMTRLGSIGLARLDAIGA
jgi:PD-(D/E)XK nuclease superfamily